jgi:hypothetical protein
MRKESECYCILLQSISKVLCSFDIDSIATEVQCGQYLYEEVKQVKWFKDCWINFVTEFRIVLSDGKGTPRKVAFLFSFFFFKDLIVFCEIQLISYFDGKIDPSFLRCLISREKSLISLPNLNHTEGLLFKRDVRNCFKSWKYDVIKIICFHIFFRQQRNQKCCLVCKSM